MSKVRKLGRKKDARRLLLRNLVKQLLQHGVIETSQVKAKALQGLFDKLVNIGQKNSLIAQKRIASFFGNNKKITKDFFEVVKKTENKTGTTRIIRLGRRLGDNSLRVKIEIIKKPTPLPKKVIKKKKVIKSPKS